MNILITGAGGFAGGNLIRYFTERGHRVTGTYRSKRPCLDVDCALVQQELSTPINIPGRFDAIIHTACAPGGDFQTCKRDNIDSMQQLISFARAKGLRTLINFSTRSIYGNGKWKEVFEDSDRVNQDYYGLTKYSGECLLRDADDLNGINLRVPGIAGPGAHNTWLVEMVKKLRNDEPVTVSDFFTKNFVWIFDIAVFTEKLINESTAGKRFRYDTVNLACKKGVNNTVLVSEIVRRTGSRSVITVVPPGEGLFILRADRAFEMGFQPHDPMEITDLYLDTLGLSRVSHGLGEENSKEGENNE